MMHFLRSTLQFQVAAVTARETRAIRYSGTIAIDDWRHGVLDAPLTRGMTDRF
jgi:hypothetical protein